MLMFTVKVHRRSVFQVPPVESPFQKPPTNAYENAGDGAPSIVFACAHPGAETLVFGANEPNSKGFPEVAAVSRQIRDTRLSAYIPYAQPAFYSLKEKDRLFMEELQSNHNAPSSNKKALVCDARKRAIRLMRDDSSFLGGTHEMGVAVRTTDWKANHPCYLCQGMVGCEVVKQWKENEAKKYPPPVQLRVAGRLPSFLCGGCDLHSVHGFECPKQPGCKVLKSRRRSTCEKVLLNYSWWKRIGIYIVQFIGR